MKKKFLQIVLLALLGCYISTESQAFLLPPFKTDASVIGQIITEGANHVSTQAQGLIKQAQTIATKILYGDGEESKGLMGFLNQAVDYTKKTVSSALDKLKSLNKKQAAEQEASIAEQDAEAAKVAAESEEIDANIAELEKEAAETPNVSKKAKLRERINKLKDKKQELQKKAAEKISEIQKKANDKIAELKERGKELVKDLKGKIDSILPGKKVKKDDDAKEEISETVGIYSVGENVEVTANSSIQKRKLFKELHFKNLGNTSKRATNIRSILKKDDENAAETTDLSAQAEGANASMDIAGVEATKNVMQALINQAELILLQLNMMIDYDMANTPFKNFDQNQAINDFDFNNYRFVPDDVQVEEETGTVETAEASEALDKTIAVPSADAVADGISAINNQGGDEND